MSAATESSPRRRDTTALWISLGLVVATLLAYWPVSRFEFVSYDDPDFVTANPHVKAGLTVDGFKWAWHSEVARNWHPITMLTHMVDCQLFGLNAGRHHLTNLLFHLANTLLLFHLLKLLTGLVWRSAFIAGLFALHPVHAESVAWIAERKDVLSTFFLFLTIWSYVCHVRAQGIKSAKGRGFYALALIFFALGLMSKPMLVTGPFVLLLLDFWPLGRFTIPGHAAKPAPKNIRKPPAAAPIKAAFPYGVLVEKIPFLAMSVVLCVVTFVLQQQGGAMLTGTSLPFSSRIENALIAYVRYIGKMFWPRNLAALYLRTGDWPLWQAALAGVALVVVSILAIAQRRRRPWLAMGWFWFLGTLVPVIGLVQVGMQTMADRFTYVPLIGLFIVVTWGGCELARSWRVPVSAPGVVAILVLTTCMGLTVRQVGYWKDSETLFKRMIAVTRNNFMAHYNLANVYTREKRNDEAAANYEAALAEEPNYADAHNNYAGLLLGQKRFDEAIHQYAEAIRVNRQFLYYFNYANALADAASARHDTNEFAQAVKAYAQAEQLNPASGELHNNLGMTWDAQGKQAEAAAEFREAVRLNPGFEEAHYNLANDLAHLGKLNDAIEEYLVAERLNPTRAENYNGLGVCYAMENKMADAARQFQELLHMYPDNAAANGNMGNTLAAENRFDEAIAYYLAALRINPRDFQSEFNLGLTYFREGKRAEAETHYRQALRLNPDDAQARAALADLEKSKVNQT